MDESIKETNRCQFLKGLNNKTKLTVYKTFGGEVKFKLFARGSLKLGLYMMLQQRGSLKLGYADYQVLIINPRYYYNEGAQGYVCTFKTKKAVCSLLDYYTHQRRGAKAANVSCLN